jgi:hypothetical protein
MVAHGHCYRKIGLRGCEGALRDFCVAIKRKARLLL